MLDVVAEAIIYISVIIAGVKLSTAVLTPGSQNVLLFNQIYFIYDETYYWDFILTIMISF